MKGIVLLSGGIDSPVAAYMAGKEGAALVLVHFDNRPFTEHDEAAKAVRLMRHLETVLRTRFDKVIVPHEESQKAFAAASKRNLQCVLCRRMMFRVVEKLANRFEADCIITGESLGQVASQTLANIAAEDNATSIPIIRPLIGLDKTEIERIAKEIGTYEISTSSGASCTAAPKKPTTYSRLAEVLEEESRVDFESLADEEASRASYIE